MKRSILALASGAFILGAAEFVMMGILPQTAAAMQVSIPAAGNLISGPSVRGPRRTSYSVMFGSASTSNGEISPRSNLRRATSAIMAALSVQADKGGTVTRIP